MHPETTIMLPETTEALDSSLFRSEEDPSPNVKRTINEVLDLDTGDEISAFDFFQKPESTIFTIRRKQEQAIQEDTFVNCFVCYYCNQIVKIKGKPQKEGKTILLNTSSGYSYDISLSSYKDSSYSFF